MVSARLTHSCCFAKTHHPSYGKGSTLEECLGMFELWLQRNGLSVSHPEEEQHGEVKSFWLVTWTDWDLGIMLTEQCQRTSLDKAAYFDRWVDLKKICLEHFKKSRFLFLPPLSASHSLYSAELAQNEAGGSCELLWSGVGRSRALRNR